MARMGLAVPGKTLGRIEGLAGLRTADLRYSVRRTALTILAIGALVAGVAALSASTKGVADSRVTPGNVGERVIDVGPTGYGWAAGVRPGQLVDVLIASDEPGGWRLETIDGKTRITLDGPGADANLNRTLLFALVALLVAYGAVVFLRTRRSWVLPAAAIALLAASVPLEVDGDPALSTLVMAGAAVIPVASYGLRLPGRFVRIIAIGAIAGLTATWSVMHLAGDPGYLGAEDARSAIALWATLALVVERGIVPSMSGHPLRLVRPRLFDVLIVGGLALLTLVVGLTLGIPALATGFALLCVVAFIPAARGRLTQPLEAALLADIRNQAAAEASEAERARLARELHDVPLQELAAVIRRLEILPGAEAESEDLRALAGHLRNVATELRPPVLDDLGLPAALDYLAEEATTSSLGVTVDLNDDTGFGTERRPPTEVELAFYRIASEAVANAVKHSGGTGVHISGGVAPDRVELVMTDDGAGLASEAARGATKRKRLGLASMRWRAEAIDAELSIDGSSRGTTVRVVWQG
jgi:signal transduction histidine kinase